MEICHRLSDAQRAEVSELLDAARDADGHEALAEHKRVALSHAAHHAPLGFVAFMWRSAGGRLDGYAQLATGRFESTVEVVVRPEARGGDAGAAAVARLLGAAQSELAARGGATLRYFMARPPPARLDGALRLGFVPSGRLAQMAAGLPMAAGPADLDPELDVALRAFRPGQDEEPWLAVNNRAFADHPEQGGWTLADLLDREAAPWFDPGGFVVAESGGRIAGSCWTKIHSGLDPPLGEIYVISVDPAWHGRGLGRALTLAGLDHLWHQGLGHAMLYVDEDNESAVALYRSLGFTVDHVDVAFVRQIGPAAAGSRVQPPDTPTSRPMP